MHRPAFAQVQGSLTRLVVLVNASTPEVVWSLYSRSTSCQILSISLCAPSLPSWVPWPREFWISEVIHHGQFINYKHSTLSRSAFRPWKSVHAVLYRCGRAAAVLIQRGIMVVASWWWLAAASLLAGDATRLRSQRAQQ